ncbi:YhdP family protein [Arhodomonas sp. KWT]|uniref:YhdP family protein n=1 Tax=Arhodomonas sp. KWT TaxID=2679915 RepID=UPI0013D2AA13|nr:YhdP family protein [Arhodomonas sp. KWT]
MPTTPPRRLTGIVLYTLALVLGLVALAGVGARLAVSHVDRYQDTLTRLAGEALGREVEVGRVSGRMNGWRPELRFTDVRIGGGDTRLELPAVTVDIDPWRSLTEGALRASRITAEGSALTLVQQPGGGLAPAESASLPLAALPSRIALRDGVVRLIGRGGLRNVVLTGVSADLVRDDGELRVAAEGQAPGIVEGDVRIAYQGAADGGQGVAYVRARAARLSRLAGWLPPAVRPEGLSGRVDLELWSWREEGRISDVRARLRASDMTLHGVAVQRLTGQARWQPAGDGWRVDLWDWRWRHDDTDGVMAVAALARDPGEWRLGVPRLAVGPLRTLMLSVPGLPGRLSEVLESLSGEGAVTDLRASLSGTDWRVSANLKDAGLTANGRWPGIGGISGRFVAADQGGRFQLRAGTGTLRLPAFFREPLPLDAARVSGEWRHREDGLWRIHVPELAWESPDGTITGGAALWLGMENGPFLDLSASLRDGVVSRVSHYIPARVMKDDKLVAWLDQAFVDGRVPSGDLRLYGPLRAMPFRDGEGLFRVRVHGEGVRFSFHPEWPAIGDGVADLRFLNDRMTVTAEAGTYQGTHLVSGEALIPRLGKHAQLQLSLESRGPAEDMLDFLRDSPVGAHAPPLFDALHVSDAAVPLSLKLDVPLEEVERGDVDGRVDLDGATVTLDGEPYRLTGVAGRIAFSERGLAWDGLTGTFAGAPWRSSAQTRLDSRGSRIMIDAAGRAGVAELLPGMPALAGRTEGEADWRLSLDAPGFPPHGRDGDMHVSVRSDLRGMAVDLPGGFGKAADGALALRAEAAAGRNGLAGPVSVVWGDRAALRLALDGTDVTTAAIALGGGDVPALPEAGTRITGSLDTLAPGGLAGAAPAGVQALPSPLTVSLRVAHLHLDGYQARDVDLSARPEDRGWRVAFSGPDLLGELRIPPTDGSDPLSVNLERARLSPVDSGGEGGGGPRETVERLPAAQVRVGDLTVGDYRFGRVELDLAPPGAGNRLRRLHVENPVMEATVTGEGGADGVRLKVQVQASNAGAALERLGYPGALEGGSGRLNATLRWPGRLLEPEVATMDGRVGFEVKDAVLPSVEPGAGRVLGLLSLPLLPRRLLLDFSDVTDEGLAVDRVKAALNLSDGVLTPEQFFLEGPAGRIDIAGPVNLVTQRLDQTVTVTPRVSSALPLIGGLAGGPPGAVLLFLAQRVFGDDVDRLNRYRYRVTGSFDDPKTEPLEIDRGNQSRSTPGRGLNDGESASIAR